MSIAAGRISRWSAELLLRIRPGGSLLRRFYCEQRPATLEKSINQVTLLGRVGIEPQLRGTDANPVVVFTLATNSNYRYETGEVQQKTQWHRISVFKPFLRNSVHQYTRKGSRVLVQGRLVYGEVTDTKGATHVTSTVVADDVIFLSQGARTPAAEDESIADASYQ
uniref:Putative single-stranded dna-binding protein mitochondrial n=1 Tax=Amblyomma tuberculatum TaxID=48802 RepID=A0A6M2E472_9ACAR